MKAPSLIVTLEISSTTAGFLCRSQESMYTTDGQKIMEQLWDETLEEFDLASVRNFLGAVK